MYRLKRCLGKTPEEKRRSSRQLQNSQQRRSSHAENSEHQEISRIDRHGSTISTTSNFGKVGSSKESREKEMLRLDEAIRTDVELKSPYPSAESHDIQLDEYQSLNGMRPNRSLKRKKPLLKTVRTMK